MSNFPDLAAKLRMEDQETWAKRVALAKRVVGKRVDASQLLHGPVDHIFSILLIDAVDRAAGSLADIEGDLAGILECKRGQYSRR